MMKTIIREKAERYWNMDLEELESSLGTKDPLSLTIAPVDERIPPQGSVLTGRVSYLPKEKKI